MHAEAQARMKEIVLAMLPNLRISDDGDIEIAATGTLEPLSKFLAQNFDKWIVIVFFTLGYRSTTPSPTRASTRRANWVRFPRRHKEKLLRSQ